jgi:PAS domain S-box-containing protein
MTRATSIPEQSVVQDPVSRLFAAAAQQARESIVITDATIDLPGPRIVFVNAAFTKMTGYTAEDVLGKTPRILQGPKTSRVLLDRLRATLEQGKVFNGEGINYRKDGSEFYIDWQIVPIRGAYGAITHFVAFQRDITERRRAEQVLAESEERYRLLVESSPDAMLVQAEGRIVFANVATAKLLGAERPEMIVGMGFTEILPPDFRAEGQQRLIESAENGAPLSQQTLVRMDGVPVKVESLGIPLTFAGKPAIQIILHDLTERLLLEEQFRKAQRLESLGMLAAGIAHDLNNVLAPILMGAPMLRETASSATDRHFLTAMENSALRGAEMVRQILGFARGVGGEPQTIQMGYLLSEIVSVLNRTFPKSIKITLRVPKDLWPVEANPTQIHQVLLNLTVNARDAMPQGGELRLRAENCALDDVAASAFPDARPGRWVVLHVEDTGTGIPADVLKRMWEPFFTTKPADKGTGLGLSTVRGIVEAHGGFVIVQTLAGRGTTFRAYFPAAAGTLSVDIPVSLAPRGQGELILVADDVASLRSMMETILTRYGYRVLLAVDGNDALDQFTHHKEIELVITDLDMPTLPGSALARKIWQLKPTMKILAMSGLEAASADPLRPKHFEEAFLLKPFAAQELLVFTHHLLHPDPVEFSA